MRRIVGLRGRERRDNRGRVKNILKKGIKNNKEKIFK